MYFYRDCNQLDIFKKYKNSNLINISDIVKELIVLPTYPKYQKQQILMNIKVIRKFLENEKAGISIITKNLTKIYIKKIKY